MDKQPTQEEKLYAAYRFFPAGLSLDGGRSVSVDEMYNYIFDLFLVSLEKHGFKLLKSKKTFSRKTKSGVDEISINGIARNHFWFDFVFQKRIDEIQKIVTKFQYENGINSINNFKVQHTTFVCYSNIKKSSIEAQTLSSFQKDLENVLVFIETEIIPYFDKLESLDFLNDTLNYPEKDEHNHFSYFSRNKKAYAVVAGLVTAKKLNDPNYASLFEKYMNENDEKDFLSPKLLKLNSYQ